MAKTLKDLNWSMFTINMGLGFATGLSIALTNDMSLRKAGFTIALCMTTSLIGFLTDAKKKLSRR